MPQTQRITKLTKLDVAKRQLRTAIRLFFAEGDPISIHTLVAAAHDVLQAIAKSEGHASMVKDSDRIKPEHKKEYYQRINAAQNFFKHADRDVAGTLDFNPETTVFLLYDCAAMHQSITGGDFREVSVFAWWFLLTYPQLIKPGPALEAAQKSLAMGTLTKAMCLEAIDHPELGQRNLIHLKDLIDTQS